jgi:hypothetical protein
MKSTFFWSSLAIVGLVIIVGLYIFQQFDVFKPHLQISILFYLIMLATTVTLYYLGKTAVESENKYGFIRLVIVSVMFKIVLVLVMMALYVKIAVPENRYFVLPVIVIYLMFSVFETYVLYRLANVKQQKDHE